MKKTLLAILSIVCFSLFSNSATAQGFCGGSGPQPGSDWAVPNSSLNVSGSTVTITDISFCNTTTATPPWTSSNYIFNLAATYRPTATRVFTASNPSTTFQVTVQTNGNFYVKYVSGVLPGRGTSLTSGSYTK